MPFERRKLGRTSLEVSPVGIGGGYGFGGRSIEYAFEQGINYFFWSPWVPTYIPMEMGLKRILPRHRDEVVLATAAYSWLFPGSIERTVHKHLRRLRIDRIDLFILGWVMRESQQGAVDELLELQEKGLVRHIGFSAHKRAMIERMSRTWPDFDLLMLRYNAAHRGAETEIFDHLDAGNRPGIAAFNALKHGAMMRRPGPWPKERPIPTARECYRFVLSSPHIDLCLAGPNNRRHVDELAKVIEEGAMSPDELAFMREFGDVRHG